MHGEGHRGRANDFSDADKSPVARLKAALFSLVFLAGHALAIYRGYGSARYVSLGFLTLAPLLAGLACAFRGWHDPERVAWGATAVAMVLWSAGMAANIADNLFHSTTDSVSCTSMLLFVLYGVPLLFTVASAEDEAWHVRSIDACTALALGYLFFVHTFAISLTPETTSPRLINLRLMFDIENAFIALFALTRLVATHTRQKREFFLTMTVFSFVYFASAAYIKHMEMDTDYGSPVDLLIDLPFLLLLCLAFRHPPKATVTQTASRCFDRAVLAGSPLMLPAMLLMVSALLVLRTPVLAISGCAMAILGYGLRNVLVQLQRDDERDALEQLSHIDALTGLPNRRRFDECLRLEWDRALRSGDELVLLMIDIDHFKSINDQFGHSHGDKILRAVGQALGQCARRASDVVCRYGGEEFAIVMPSTRLADAQLVAKAMRFAVERLRLVSPASPGVVTVSIGASQTFPAHGATSGTLVEMADRALYEAKKSGRNQLVCRSLT